MLLRNKKGFTLAEVLITLGIIGVVSALTVPMITVQVGKSKIGPKLVKAKSTFDNACETMLVDNNASSIHSLVSTQATEADEKIPSKALGKELMRYMKISPIDEYNTYSYSGKLQRTALGHTEAQPAGTGDAQPYLSEDGMVYWIWKWNSINQPGVSKDWLNSEYPNIPTHQVTGAIVVDVNGLEQPNTMAKDLFLFYIMNDGTLQPAGATYWRKHNNSKYKVWSDSDNAGEGVIGGGTCVKGHVSNAAACTGSIFENNYKIIYE